MHAPRDLRPAAPDDAEDHGEAGMRAIPGGTFIMGSDRHYPEERPARGVTVAGFRMDATAVTNDAFAAFVAATGYVTVAERPLDPALYPGARGADLAPGSLVFAMTEGPVDTSDIRNWWRWTPGACWRRPEGPGSGLAGRGDHPVVQVAYDDAAAYSDWAGKALPTEAEWEFAARGGLDGREFAWGDAFTPGGRHLANTWQGPFPWRNLVTDGHAGTAPVRAYPPNGYGLFEVCGNVWEWTADWYAPRGGAAGEPAPGCCGAGDAKMQASFDPGQPGVRIPRRVVKGGSFLCAPSYCRRYRPAARHPQMVDTGMSHIGFRCVLREPA